jgi:DNA invertase Pin-like site-specific DNA recombinase
MTSAEYPDRRRTAGQRPEVGRPIDAGGALYHEKARTMREAFAYARVSTDEQANRDLSVPFQIDRIERYAAAHGYVIVDRFLDEGYSGESMNRPAMSRMLEAAKAKRPAAIIYLDEDRWSRGYGGPAIRRELRVDGIRCIEASSGRGDTEDYFSVEQAEEMAGFIARDQPRKLAQIIPGRMRAAVEKGEKGIGGTPPWGYVRENFFDAKGRPDSRLVIDPTKAPIMVEAFQLYADGASTKDVANFLEPYRGLMHPSTVSRMLRNPRYRGANVIGKKRSQKRGGIERSKYQPPETWTVFEGAHDPIVSDELFQRVQARLDGISARKQRTRTQPEENPIPPGILKCASCGSVVEFHVSKKPGYNTLYTYVCRRRRERGVKNDKIEGCEGSILVGEVRKQTLAHIARLLEGENLRDMIEKYQPPTNPELGRMEALVTASAKKRDRVLRAIEATDDPATSSVLYKSMEAAVKELRDAEHRLHALRAAAPPVRDLSTIRTDAYAIREALLAMDSRKLALGSLFSEIRLDFKRATIIRNAYRTLNAKKPKGKDRSNAAMAEARKRAAELADEAQWANTRPVVEFVYAVQG